MLNTFTMSIRYVEAGGNTYLLPDPASVKLWDMQIEKASSDLRGVKDRMQTIVLGRSSGGSQQATDETEFSVLSTTAASMQASVIALQREAALYKAVMAQYWDNANTLRAELHRYDWHERFDAAALAASTSTNERVVLDRFMASIVTTCLDGWNRSEPVTAENVEALSPQMLNAIYDALLSQSEPSGLGALAPELAPPQSKGIPFYTIEEPR